MLLADTPPPTAPSLETTGTSVAIWTAQEWSPSMCFLWSWLAGQQPEDASWHTPVPAERLLLCLQDSFTPPCQVWREPYVHFQSCDSWLRPSLAPACHRVWEPGRKGENWLCSGSLGGPRVGQWCVVLQAALTLFYVRVIKLSPRHRTAAWIQRFRATKITGQGGDLHEWNRLVPDLLPGEILCLTRIHTAMFSILALSRLDREENSFYTRRNV